ncbi:DUF3826 domain-containing protein [bacterium]|nr:DUF3826 domain-containing protein [bacterium]
MKKLSHISYLLVSLGLAIVLVEADTAAVVAAKSQATIDNGDAPSWWKPSLPPDIQRQVASKAKEWVGKLDLDEALQAKATSLVGKHYSRVWAWHQEVDEKLDNVWAAWDAARSLPKDELKALAIITERIDPIYAEFAPQIQGFLRAMHQAIGEEKSTKRLNQITQSPGAERTYKAYLGMVPEMTDEEKAILWKRMVQAREDSLAAWSSKRIVKSFKKYKVGNEFSIDYFGYDYRKRYQA